MTDEVTRRLEARILPLAAICAAPSIPPSWGCCAAAGPPPTGGFTGVLEDNGAEVSESGVVVDDNLLTSRGMGTAVDLGLEIIRTCSMTPPSEGREGIVHQR